MFGVEFTLSFPYDLLLFLLVYLSLRFVDLCRDSSYLLLLVMLGLFSFLCNTIEIK